MEQQNAIIKSADIAIERGAFLTLTLHLEYRGGCAQGAGGFVLATENKACSMQYIRRLFLVLGVESFRRLSGTPCRVRGTHTSVEAVGHFLEDRWFEMKPKGSDGGV